MKTALLICGCMNAALACYLFYLGPLGKMGEFWLFFNAFMGGVNLRGAMAMFLEDQKDGVTA